MVCAGLCVALGLAGLSAAHAKGPEIGKAAPKFTLTDIAGNKVSLKDYKDKYVVLEWVNHGCPFVRKHYDSGNMQALQRELTGRGNVWLSIAGSAKGKQGYFTPGEWATVNAGNKVAATTVLLDSEGKVGKAYGAKTTPHMFVIDPRGVLIYMGAIDDKPTTDKADIAGAKNYVRQALQEAKAGKPVTESSTKPYGCSVKYK